MQTTDVFRQHSYLHLSSSFQSIMSENISSSIKRPAEKADHVEVPKSPKVILAPKIAVKEKVRIKTSIGVQRAFDSYSRLQAIQRQRISDEIWESQERLRKWQTKRLFVNQTAPVPISDSSITECIHYTKPVSHIGRLPREKWSSSMKREPHFFWG